MVSFGLIPWLVVDLDWFSWLPLPGLWAGFYLVFMCPGCGLGLSMVGMLVAMLGSLFVGLVLVVCFGLRPFPMFLGEVLSVCCPLWLPFGFVFHSDCLFGHWPF